MNRGAPDTEVNLRDLEEFLEKATRHGAVVGVTKAAKLLNFSDRQIRRWCEDGTLEGANQEQRNSKWLIPVASLGKLQYLRDP